MCVMYVRTMSTYDQAKLLSNVLSAEPTNCLNWAYCTPITSGPVMQDGPL